QPVHELLGVAGDTFARSVGPRIGLARDADEAVAASEQSRWHATSRRTRALRVADARAARRAREASRAGDLCVDHRAEGGEQRVEALSIAFEDAEHVNEGFDRRDVSGVRLL